MSLLSPEEAQAARIGRGLDTEALQAAIDEEEAELAALIGPLAGERTQRFPLSGLRPLSSEVILQRPTDSITECKLDDDVITGDVELRPDGWVVAHLPEGTRNRGIVAVKYTPNDELRVKRALKRLLGLTLSDQATAGLAGEIIGSYSWTRSSGTTQRARASIVRSLQYPARAGSTRLLSSVPHGTAGQLGR